MRRFKRLDEMRTNGNLEVGCLRSSDGSTPKLGGQIPEGGRVVLPRNGARRQSTCRPERGLDIELGSLGFALLKRDAGRQASAEAVR